MIQNRIVHQLQIIGEAVQITKSKNGVPGKNLMQSKEVTTKDGI